MNWYELIISCNCDNHTHTHNAYACACKWWLYIRIISVSWFIVHKIMSHLLDSIVFVGCLVTGSGILLQKRPNCARQVLDMSLLGSVDWRLGTCQDSGIFLEIGEALMDRAKKVLYHFVCTDDQWWILRQRDNAEKARCLSKRYPHPLPEFRGMYHIRSMTWKFIQDCSLPRQESSWSNWSHFSARKEHKEWRPAIIQFSNQLHAILRLHGPTLSQPSRMDG